MKQFLLMLGMATLISCSASQVPTKWSHLGIAEKGLVKVEKQTDENGLYAQYRGVSRDDLLRSISQSLVASGYVKVGTAFDGNVIGFTKGKDQLAVKVDQLDDTLYLAIFNEKGKEPLLHGVVFRKYVAGPGVSGEEAKARLLKELEK
jgi:hypothetical protein